MGTLVFHIIIFACFVLAEVNVKGDIKEESLMIEFVDFDDSEDIKEDILNSEHQQNQSNFTNLASNKLSKSSAVTTSKEKFFDNEYQKEIDEAKKMVSAVDNQLKKEKIDLNNIKMPVQTTEGMNPDSIKNVIYTGESNIVYYLENRYHTILPIPVYLTQKGGLVVVDIQVDRFGNVVKAIPQKNNNDELTLLYAEEAAKRTKFNIDNSAPVLQSGKIQYTFVAQ